jgi:hypothetical protein
MLLLRVRVKITVGLIRGAVVCDRCVSEGHLAPAHPQGHVVGVVACLRAALLAGPGLGALDLELLVQASACFLDLRATALVVAACA